MGAEARMAFQTFPLGTALGTNPPLHPPPGALQKQFNLIDF